MVALAFPLDLITSGVFWRRSFRLQPRQEVSRTAGGASIRKNFGRPLWRADYVSRSLTANEVSEIRARLDALDGGVQTFLGYDPARCRPIAHPSKIGLPDGSTGRGTIASVFPDNKRVSLAGMGEGFTVSTGDLMQIGSGDLYSVVQGGVANSSGVVAEVEVRPFLWPGTAAGNAVSFMRPACVMAVDPGSISEDVSTTTGRGTYSFTAWEARVATTN